MIERGSERFDRHRLVPGWDQQRLADATAIILGAGALGNETARLLAMSGIGRLILCDPDTVARSNLSRCSLFRERDIGRLKVDAAMDALVDLSPGIRIDRRPMPLLRGVGLAELRDADLILGCLDSRAARLQLAGRCNLVGAGWIDGGTHPWGGEVRPYLDPNGPCYGCALTAAERSVSDIPWSCSDIQPASPEGAAAPSSSLVAAWQVMVAVRVLFNLPVPADVMAVDGVRGLTGPVRIDRDPECPLHMPIPVASVERIPVSSRDTIAALFAALPEGAVPLAWEPVQRSAQCTSCRHVATGWRLPAASPCPQCGAPMRPETTLELNGAPAEMKLAELGVAPREILAVRMGEGFLWRELGD